MSTAISSVLARGDVIDVRAPPGALRCPLSRRAPLCWSPAASALPVPVLPGDAGAAAASPEVHLAYANSLAATEAFADRLASLVAAMPELTIDRCWSRAGNDVPADIHRGRLDIRHLRLETFDVSPAIYFCGPSGMIASLKAELVRAGHPDRLTFEEALPPAASIRPRCRRAPIRSPSCVPARRQSGNVRAARCWTWPRRKE